MEVYYRAGYGYSYAVDLFVKEGMDENIALREEQFEVIEEYDRPLSGTDGPTIISSEKDEETGDQEKKNDE